MTDYGPSRIGVSFDVKPHAYDPVANPELFEGVLTRRMFAFIIDLVVIAIPLVIASIFILLFGFVTFGLGWALFWLLSPASVVWALVYYGFTLGGSGIGDAGHAHHGIGNAHLVRRAGLFRARRGARRRLLGERQHADAIHPPGRLA